MTRFRFKKRLKLWWKLQRNRVKDSIIFSIVAGLIFLPVRLLFYTFVSHAWHTNLGLMTSIAVLIFLLVKYNKLGRFGKLFHRVMIRVASSKIIGAELIFGMCFNIFISWFGLYLYDYAEAHMDEIYLMNAIVNPYGIQFKASDVNFLNNTNIPKQYTTMEFSKMMQSPFWIREQARAMQPEMQAHFLETHMSSVIFFLAYVIQIANDDALHGWGTHFTAVFFVEELEGAGLYFFYRKVYLTQYGTPWKDLGMYEKNIKRFIKKNKKIYTG